MHREERISESLGFRLTVISGYHDFIDDIFYILKCFCINFKLRFVINLKSSEHKSLLR